jgi:hypothetical protein
VLNVTVYGPDVPPLVPVNDPVSVMGDPIVIVAVVDDPVYEPVPDPVQPLNVLPDDAVAAILTDSLTFSHCELGVTAPLPLVTMSR